MLPTQIQRVIQELSKLPGIGPKSAERLAFHLLKKPKDHVGQLAESIANLKEGIKYCQKCCNLSDQDVCRICDNSSRDKHQICIVEEPMDVFALENSGAYKGLYHVLHGAISPLDGVGPDQLTIDALMKRVEEGGCEEIILATNPNVTGEATSIYLSRLLRPRSLRITHLAQGLPMGGELEFADPDTLKRAMMGRRE
jgi:recombination protein RecR